MPDDAISDDPATGLLTELPPAHWAQYRYTLADVLPWMARGLGAFGAVEGAGLPAFDAADVVLLLVDGLGDRLLQRYAQAAPTLTALRATQPSAQSPGATTLRVGFPATTATSVTSLTSGAPCGLHGIIGYSFRPDDDTRTRGPRRLLNALRWTLDGPEGPSAQVTYPPDLVAPLAGALSELADSGVRITYVMPGEFRGTGLTKVAFRAAGRHIPASTPEAIRTGVADSLGWQANHRRFVYAYTSILDTAGHIYGPGSAEWLRALTIVDQLVADLVSDLPAGAVLAVTGDHGMLTATERIDLDTETDLTTGIEAIAGEPRVRHLYIPGGDESATAEVIATWQERLGSRVAMATRAQALDEQWFGSRVTDRIAARIGDAVAVARGGTVLVRSQTDPNEAAMPGHHGAWTADELLVPLLTAVG